MSRIAEALKPLRPIAYGGNIVPLRAATAKNPVYNDGFLIMFKDGSEARFTIEEIDDLRAHVDLAYACGPCRQLPRTDISHQDLMDLLLCAFVHSKQTGGPPCATCGRDHHE